MASRHRLSVLLNTINACRPARKWVRECVERGMTDYQIWRSCPGAWLNYLISDWEIRRHLPSHADNAIWVARERYWPDDIYWASRVPASMQRKWARELRRIVNWETMKRILEEINDAS